MSATHRSGDQAARVVAVEPCRTCFGLGRIVADLLDTACRACHGSGHWERRADGTAVPMERSA